MSGLARATSSSTTDPIAAASAVVVVEEEEGEGEEYGEADPRPLWPSAERYRPGTPLAAASTLASSSSSTTSPIAEYTFVGGSANAVLARAKELIESGLGQMTHTDARTSRLLHSLAREVLQPAARLPVPTQRARWATWAGELLERAEGALPPSPILPPAPVLLPSKRPRVDGSAPAYSTRSALVLSRARASVLEGRAHAAGPGHEEKAREALRLALELVNRAEADELQCRRLRTEALAEMRALDERSRVQFGR
jgi:hypothetical protein